MSAGKILVAEHEGTFVLKLVGDVRLTLCTTIDEYCAEMFSKPTFVGVIVDLSEAEGVDSTTLGLLAKLAIQAGQRFQLTPIILCPNPNLVRLLHSMGFQKVMDIRENFPTQSEVFGELAIKNADEGTVKQKVIEAHRLLMDMNEQNRETFSALMTSLEQS